MLALSFRSVEPLAIAASPHPRDALIDSPTAAECAAAPAIRRHAPTDERASKAPPASQPLSLRNCLVESFPGSEVVPFVYLTRVV